MKHIYSFCQETEVNRPSDFLPHSPTCSLGQAWVPTLSELFQLDKLPENNSLLSLLGYFSSNSER